MTQHYIGTKIVEAWAQEKDGLPGYAVKYADGYVSWSPADAFEEAYLPIGHVGGLSPHLQRLKGEYTVVSANLDKLGAFVESEGFHKLPEEQRKLLIDQVIVMVDFVSILEDRLRISGVEV